MAPLSLAVSKQVSQMGLKSGRLGLDERGQKVIWRFHDGGGGGECYLVGGCRLSVGWVKVFWGWCAGRLVDI